MMIVSNFSNEYYDDNFRTTYEQLQNLMMISNFSTEYL